MRYWLIFSLIVVPFPSLAAVLINEVAWMGSIESANHEWIELHNTGSSISVEGWTLSDGMNLTIPLTGTIPANSYAVLERTSDESASGSAFLIYTGALVNTGATLVLKRSDGGIEDQVSGGENWQSIGGDNVTKETAQYTTSGWITAASTPGIVNRSVDSVPPPQPAPAPEPSTPADTKEASATKSSGSRNSSETVQLSVPVNTLQLTVDAQTVGYVNQGITFEAEPSGIGRTLAHSVVYRWNFGDGNIGFGKHPSHHYQFPGTYVVTLYATVGTQEHLSRHEITILPITLSLSKNEHGDIQVNNDSPYEIDVSGYTVSGADDFVFPAYSIMLPNQTITIPKQKITLGTNSGLPTLYDSLSQRISVPPASVATLAFASTQTPEPTVAFTPLSPPPPRLTIIDDSKPSEDNRFRFANTTSVAPRTTPVLTEVTGATNTVLLSDVATGGGEEPGPQRWPYLALITLLLICFGAIFFKPKVTNSL